MKPSFKLKGMSGVYQIRNTVNCKVYVGRTKCFYKRCYQYLYDFKKQKGEHINDHLMRSLNKYGIDKFAFEVIELCEHKNSPERELHWMMKKNSTDRDVGYNIRLDVNGSMVTSPETSLKISKRLKGEWDRGERSGHSEKLKQSWDHRDRGAQSRVMSKSLTKYEYDLSIKGVPVTTCKYKDFTEEFKKTGYSKFYRKNATNKIFHKGVTVERRLIV